MQIQLMITADDLAKLDQEHPTLKQLIELAKPDPAELTRAKIAIEGLKADFEGVARNLEKILDEQDDPYLRSRALRDFAARVKKYADEIG